MRSAAVLVAVVSPAAWAQDLTQTNALGLRGTEQPLAQTQGGTLLAPQNTGLNPVGLNPTGLNSTGLNGTANSSLSSGLRLNTNGGEDNRLAPNYGRPKPKKSPLYQLPTLRKLKPVGYPPLPPLKAYKTAPGMRKRGSNPPHPIDPPPPTVAVLPSLPHAHKPKREAKPYAPLGVDVGSLRLYPYAEADTGYDSNPNQQSTQVVGSTYLHGEAGVRLQSLWSRNSVSGELRGGYYDFLSVPTANRPDASGTLNARIDVTRRTKINLASRFDLATQQPGSPQLAIPGSVFITNRPLYATLGQTVGVIQQFNRLSLSLSGAFDRSVFSDATQSDGSTLYLSRNNYNTYGITGRADYEIDPALIPFFAVTADWRTYDDYLDLDGFARDSNGIAVKAGTKFNFSPFFTGEIDGGYADRTYADRRLPHLRGPIIDASLIYSPTPLTKVTLTAETDFSETTLANASGAVTHKITGKIEHSLLRNLSVSATGSFQVNQYQGAPITEWLYSAGVEADYNLTRSVVIRGSFTHQRLTSTAPGDDYTANVFLVGLKFQR